MTPPLLTDELDLLAQLLPAPGPRIIELGCGAARMARQMLQRWPGLDYLGLEVDADYAVVGRAGQATPGLYYVGPMLRARLWEAIAIPELRTHTRQLADKILHTLHHAPQHSTHP